MVVGAGRYQVDIFKPVLGRDILNVSCGGGGRKWSGTSRCSDWAGGCGGPVKSGPRTGPNNPARWLSEDSFPGCLRGRLWEAEQEAEA